jgi:epoxyqueuosine reductase
MANGGALGKQEAIYNACNSIAANHAGVYRSGSKIRLEVIRELAAECGFDLAGATPAAPLEDAARYRDWVRRGLAGEMGYLTDHRGDIRCDPRRLLPSARSIICVGKLYNGPEAYSTEENKPYTGWISRYAWGEDYHNILRDGLRRLEALIRDRLGCEFDSKVCVDTAPLLERSYARMAGLGWIGKNTCLINEPHGSWFFLGELLTSLDIEAAAPPPERCGTCTACIDACPTGALKPWELDSRRCISYLTIELRGPAPENLYSGIGNHVFGCDICQDVCPWNRRAPEDADPEFRPRPGLHAPPLERLAALTEEEFRALFRGTPVTRARYTGFLRNVAIAMANSGEPRFRPHLERLAAHPDPRVSAPARFGIRSLQ